MEGHVNETVERRNFRKRMQQVGEAFDDFLVSLRELVKTCNFCSDGCTNKNIRDQIIEGLLDADTTEHLLQETDLTLAKAITMCQAQEAARATGQSRLQHFINYKIGNNVFQCPYVQDVVLPPTPLAEHNVRPIIRPASTAERLATLQKSVDRRHHDNEVLLWIHPTQSCLTSVMCHYH